MDIKFKDKDALSNGKNFKILEVNGSEAESTHIYDRKYSLFYAYKTLYNQWDTLFKIARENRKNGFYGLSASRMLRSYLDFFEENNVIQSDWEQKMGLGKDVSENEWFGTLNNDLFWLTGNFYEIEIF